MINMMETQQRDSVAEQMQRASLQAAFDAAGSNANDSQQAGKAKKDQKVVAVSPRSGAELPAGPGRPKGVRNRLTALRDSILDAFEQVGGTEYLAKLAQGTQSDRAAFIGLVKHVLPAQIDANVNGGIQVQLSWLAGRSIGTVAAQPADVVTQVVELQRDSAGKYRMIDPQTHSEPPREPASEPTPAGNLDPHPPIDRQAGA